MHTKAIPISQLKLNRFPKSSIQSLKAWNAADEYLIDWCHQNSATLSGKLLVINDQFGAICCSLSHYQPYCWTDSYLSKTAINNNLALNSLDGLCDREINQVDRPLADKLKFDCVLLRIPKHNSLLKFQLKSITSLITKQTHVIAAGMTKEIHKSTLKIFESVIGPTTSSLAKKKSRLIFSTPSNAIETNTQEVDRLHEESTHYQIKKPPLTIIGLPGVFSRESLDMGTRVLLEYMPETKASEHLIDLGCGTGVLGTYAAQQTPGLNVTFTDESWLAVESARRTYYRNNSLNQSSTTTFKVTNVLDHLQDNHFDHILCNPPFHQQNVQTLAIARKMFKDSSVKLHSNGQLRVVANRHLKYGASLNQYFKRVEILSKDPKFIVWLASQPKHKTN